MTTAEMVGRGRGGGDRLANNLARLVLPSVWALGRPVLSLVLAAEVKRF